MHLYSFFSHEHKKKAKFNSYRYIFLVIVQVHYHIVHKKNATSHKVFLMSGILQCFGSY